MMSTAGATNAARTIRLSATGWVTADPDITRVSVGVLIEAETAHHALAQANATMAHVVAGLKGAGIAEGDLQAAELKVKPRYKLSQDHDEDTVDGYRAATSIRVTVRDAARVGDILKLATARGANHIARIRFDVAELERLQDDARKQALQKARQRGELYARAAGAQLGPVLSIAEHEDACRGGMVGHGVPRFDLAGEEPWPVETGSRRIEVQVDVVYLLC